MPNLKNLRSLGLIELKKRANNFSKLRSTCEEYGVSVGRYHQLMEELEGGGAKDNGSVRGARSPARKKTKRRRRSRMSKDLIRKPEEIVLQTFKDFRKRIGRHTPADYDGFVSEVGVDLAKADVTLDARCPLIGYVSEVLYRHAEERKYGDVKGSGSWHKGMQDNPVRAENLEGILKANFGEEAYRQMAGELKSEYLKGTYFFDAFSGTIKLRDSEGEVSENPNVEGVICFDGESKMTVRRKLADFVVKHLSPYVQGRVDDFDTLITSCEEAAESGGERLRELERELTDIDSGMSTLKYRFEADSKKTLIEARRRLLGKLSGKKNPSGKEKIPGISFEFGKDSGHYMAIEVGGEDIGETKRNFLVSWVGIPREGIRDNVNLVNTARERDVKRANELMAEDMDVRVNLNGVEGKLGNLRAGKINASKMTFLGLEGPNFGSYLAILDELRRKNPNLKLTGTFVEYHMRTYNLMRGLMANIEDGDGGNPDIFGGATLLRGNVEDLILLDFPKDRRVRIPLNDRDRVEFLGESIDLEDYHHLIHLAESGEDVKSLSKIFGISREFSLKAVDRRVGTFDSVFLDYFGDYRGRKSEVLEKLASRRLSDEAVVAIACSKRYALSGKGPSMGEVGRILQEAGGYKVVNNGEHSYQDKTTRMAFRIYHVSRDRSV